MKWVTGAWGSLPDWGKVIVSLVLIVLLVVIILYALYLGLDMYWLVEFVTGQ